METNFYLKNLVIQNFATFKNQSIQFRQGFNAIIGETGSGKSLVLDALQLILGGRADKKVVRKDTDFSLIEASFHCDDQGVMKFLEDEGFPIEGKELVIKRLINKNGTTKTYMNHLSCTASFLASFSKRYIDLVGQFENQKLLSESYQLHLLDHYGKLSPEVLSFKKSLSEYKELQQRLIQLDQSKTNREQRLDYLNFQLQEIEKLNPSSQDEEELLKKKNLLANVEKIQKVSFQLKDIFEGDEGHPGLLSQMQKLNSILIKNKDFFEQQISEVSEIDDRLHLLIGHIDQKHNFDLDPQELEGVLERLDSYQRLKKKFGGSAVTILESQSEFLKEREQLQALDFDLEKIKNKIHDLKANLSKLAQDLHKKRQKYAVQLSKELTLRVQNLKMTGATIKLVLEELTDFSDTGMTRANFVAETNPGEGYFKVKDIASGGELSRILLSVRQILSSYDSISIFLFDEIDTGIGGETANCIGKALCQVAVNGQVIAITHLPQIAQFADVLIVVKKDIQSKDKNSRTESSVREIVGKLVQKEVKAMAQLS
ncbi:MAG: AAA family ATPase [Bdellovibrionales bacterium]|nr:AAA family ATPase [Bdellovibrionales bacterium]